jgi:hypothetical protein
MDIIRIEFFLKELYRLSYYLCDIRISFLYRKTKVYITASAGFGAQLHGRNLIIGKPLYGLKPPDNGFHERSSESLLRFGLKRKK